MCAEVLREQGFCFFGGGVHLLACRLLAVNGNMIGGCLCNKNRLNK